MLPHRGVFLRYGKEKAEKNHLPHVILRINPHYSGIILYVCNRKQNIMLDIIRNILSFIGTFLVISTVTMIILQGVVCLITNQWEMKEKTDYPIVITGILIALILIPFYYLPA